MWFRQNAHLASNRLLPWATGRSRMMKSLVGAANAGQEMWLPSLGLLVLAKEVHDERMKWDSWSSCDVNGFLENANSVPAVDKSYLLSNVLLCDF